MMKSSPINYQASNTDPASIKRSFVIRVEVFERIMEAIRNKKANDPVQHELLLGRRGSGKSTLLRRLQIEIDETLTDTHIAINTAEEQASIYRLSDLWYEVFQELGKRLGFIPELRPFSSFEDNNAYTRYLHSLIDNALQKHQRRAVLLLDNLDRILENFDDDGHLLREILSNHNNIQIIGGSTRMDEHFWRYDKPFYEFFRRHRLEGLTFDEIHTLLNHWSEAKHSAELKDYALLHRGKIEAIRIMTDGLPRTLLFFIQILLQDNTLYGFDYIKQVMDKATPLYQERLNNLTPPQRKIVQEMAFLWEACATKQLIDLCRMEGKLISSYMTKLSDYGIVETIATETKNHLYRLSERFFNMWLIVTQGNPDQKRKAKWLTIFLESWYDGEEIQELTRKHLEKLEHKNITFDKALTLTKALSQSKFIGVGDRDLLIGKTLTLNDISESDKLNLPETFYELIKDFHTLLWEGKYDYLLYKLEEIENENDGIKFKLKGLVYTHMKNYEKAEEFYLLSIKNNNKEVLTYLAELYHKQAKYELAKKYYLLAVTNEDTYAMFMLAYLYKTEGKYELAEKYYLQAIEDGDIESLNAISIFYYQINKKKSDALKYIESFYESTYSLTSFKNKTLIEVWNDVFEELRENIEYILSRSRYINISWFLENLLYLEQTNLVLSLFESEEHGKELRKRYTLLYYTTLLLLNRTENNLLLRIPPEVMPTVEDIVAQVREKQAFYRG